MKMLLGYLMWGIGLGILKFSGPGFFWSMVVAGLTIGGLELIFRDRIRSLKEEIIGEIEDNK